METHENNKNRILAKQFNKNKNFEKAIEIYEKLFENEKKFDDTVEYIFCLLQNKNHAKALEISRIAYKKFENNKKICTFYAQAIYYTQIKTDKADKNSFMKAAVAITKLVKPDDPYSPFQNTVLKTLDFIKNNYSQNSNLILQWCNKLKAEQLSTKQYEIEKKNSQKNIKIASQLEKWALYKANALKDLKEYTELLLFLEEIFKTETIKKSGYKIWLLRIKAIALQNSGNTEFAEELYSQIVLKKTDWFIIYEYSLILTQNNKNREALHKLLEQDITRTPYFAANKILNLIHTIIKDTDKHRFCDEISFHAAEIKKQAQNKPEKNFVSDFYTQTKKLKELFSELRKNYAKNAGEKHYGTIIKILPGAKAGFIKQQKNGTIYFETKEYRGQARELSEGLQVSYETAESYDKKKQQKSTKAVGIYKINS